MSSDSPRLAAAPLPGAGLVFRLFGILLVLIAANVAVGIYVEDLWFDSLGYSSVYWYRLQMQAGAFVVFGGVTTLLMPDAQPMWVNIVGGTSTVPMALLGGYLRSRRMRPSVA